MPVDSSGRFAEAANTHLHALTLTHMSVRSDGFPGQASCVCSTIIIYIIYIIYYYYYILFVDLSGTMQRTLLHTQLSQSIRQPYVCRCVARRFLARWLICNPSAWSHKTFECPVGCYRWGTTCLQPVVLTWTETRGVPTNTCPLHYSLGARRANVVVSQAGVIISSLAGRSHASRMPVS